MQNFKQHFLEQPTLSENTLWGEGIKKKPLKYAEPFLDLWKTKEPIFKREDVAGTVTLKYDAKLAKALQVGVNDEGLFGDDLEDYLRNDHNWPHTNDQHKTLLLPLKGGGEISFNKLSKENVNPRTSPSGAEWESLISIGFNIHTGHSKVKASNLTYDKELGIDEKTFAKVIEFWPNYGKASMKLGKKFVEKGFEAPMKQTGSGKDKTKGGKEFTLSKEWTSWGGKNKTPKTDMTTKEKKISLKKKGGSQLMSAKKGEAMATFNGALELMGTNKTNQKYIKSIVDIVDEKFNSVIMAGTIEDLKNPNSPLMKNLSSGEQAKLKKEVVTQQKINDEMSELMQEVFNGKGKSAEEKVFHKVYKEHFVFEASTGLKKFNAGKGTASHLVEFTEQGKISQYHPLGNVGSVTNFSISDDIKDIAKKTDFYVSFKTGSNNPYSALRTKALKLTNSYNHGVSTMRQLVLETLEEDGAMLLTEDMCMLNEWDLVGKAFNKVQKRASKVKGWVKSKAPKAMDWLKNFMNALAKKVKLAMKKIITLGKKALHALIRFFGFEVKDVTSNGPSLIFHKMQ